MRDCRQISRAEIAPISDIGRERFARVIECKRKHTVTFAALERVAKRRAGGGVESALWAQGEREIVHLTSAYRVWGGSPARGRPSWASPQRGPCRRDQLLM